MIINACFEIYFFNLIKHNSEFIFLLNIKFNELQTRESMYNRNTLLKQFSGFYLALRSQLKLFQSISLVSTSQKANHEGYWSVLIGLIDSYATITRATESIHQ